uniref:Reverse transcriptase domain-containing protein n=1 Tax=Tanacetum cinerariifolium TaxID=118510 RepID=A0A699H5S5_TANCI|nr:reverse transcriptase domain-containing protein [Tanacetum cinerariifolium]
MADQRTMAKLLRAPTEGYAEAIVVPLILVEQFELKHSLINMMTTDQFFGLEKDNPHDHIRWFNKITSTIKYKDVPNSEDLVSKFINEFFPPSRTTNLCNEISNFQQWFDESFHEAWDRYKDLLRACPHHGFTELHQLDTFYNALNPSDQDSLNAAAGGNLLERHTQDVLTIIKNKSKVCNSQNKSVVSQVKSCDANSNSSEIAKLTHAVNQQTSAVTTAMTAILKQFQATPPLASVKDVEETCVTCGGAHPYYQCLATGGNTFPELRDNIQGYVSAAAVNYNQGNFGYRPPGMANQIRPPGFAQPNVQNNQNRPTVPIPPPFINPKEDERVEETLKDPNLAEYTIKVLPPPVQKYKPPSQREYVVHQRDPLNVDIPYPSRMLKQKQQEKDEKMLKALVSNKEKLQELANTPLNENCLAVILKKLPRKLGDLGKFLIPCGFSELKCKVLADLGVSINLMPLSVWKKLGLPELISTRMTLELANRETCTPAGIARNVFVPTFLRIARALIDVHDEEMILRDGDERLTLNMRHDTSSYSNQPQKESINLINIFNNSSEDFLEDLFSNQPSGNPTFSSHPELTSPEVNNDIFDSEGGNVLPEKLLDLDSTKDLHPPLHVNLLSGSTTYFSSSNPFLEEFTDELTLITFPPKYDDDDLPFDVESDLKKIEFLLYQDIDSSLKDLIDQSNLANPVDIFVDFMPEMFTDEHALDYSSPLIFDEYDDDFLEVDFDTKNVYNDPFDSKGEKIKESKLLINELDLPCDFLPLSEYDSFISQDFSRVDAKPSTNNEDKVFNPGILNQEKPFEIITRIVQDKKLEISNAFLMLEDFDPPFYEPLFFKEVPRSKMLLIFSSENEEKVFKPGIQTSEKVHSSRILELSHQSYKFFKINKIFKSPMKIFLFSCGKDTHILAVPCLYFYPYDQFKYWGIRSS